MTTQHDDGRPGRTPAALAIPPERNTPIMTAPAIPGALFRAAPEPEPAPAPEPAPEPAPRAVAAVPDPEVLTGTVVGWDEPAGPEPANDCELLDLERPWLRALTGQRKAPNTRDLYSQGLRAFVRWHKKTWPGVPVTTGRLTYRNASDFLAALAEDGLAPGTCRARYGALRRFSAWLAADGDTRDVLDRLNPPPLGRPQVHSITPAQETAFLAACKAPPGASPAARFEAMRDEACLRLFLDTGMRAGECAALLVDDVDLDEQVVVIRKAKGNKQRAPQFSVKTGEALDRYQRRARRGHPGDNTPMLWLGSGIGRHTWGYEGISASLCRRAVMAGIPAFSLHRLRHTAASRAMDAGVPVEQILTQFGWTDLKMLQRYVDDTKVKRSQATFREMFRERDGGR